MSIIKYEQITDRIIEVRHQKVILDSDVGELYGVETRRVNEAVCRNPEKFPEDYLIYLTKQEKNELVANCDRFKRLKHSTVMPNAFTEKGLYMLATILKSPIAAETTMAIIDTFTKVRQVTHLVKKLPHSKKDSPEQHALMQRAGDIISDLIVLEGMTADETEASVEFNLAVVKFKYSIKKKAKNTS